MSSRSQVKTKEVMITLLNLMHGRHQLSTSHLVLGPTHPMRTHSIYGGQSSEFVTSYETSEILTCCRTGAKGDLRRIEGRWVYRRNRTVTAQSRRVGDKGRRTMHLSALAPLGPQMIPI